MAGRKLLEGLKNEPWIPKELRSLEIPTYRTRPLAGGTLYYYDWPWPELGKDVYPCAFLKGRTLVVASSPDYARELVGQAADGILAGAGLERDGEIKLIVGPVGQDMVDTAWGGEMLAPIISLFTVEGDQDAMALCKRLLCRMGAGHTAIIHTTDDDMARRFGEEMPASRILHNCAGSTGCIGKAHYPLPGPL